jgi:hypothetical protein
VNAVVAADGLTSDYSSQASTVSYRALSGVAADGRSLDTLLYLPIIRTKQLLSGGVTLQDALLGGRVDMMRMVTSEVADAGSGAAGVAMVANRTVTGYIRMVRAGACSRCTILAGHWYRYDAGFLRHKRCECYGVPATSVHFPNTTNPMSIFNGLSRAQQDARFGAAGAQAIRDGADIYSVVNADRGMTTVDAYGRQVITTTEGTSRRGAYYRQARADAERAAGIRYARGVADVEQGLPTFNLRTPRLMPSEIYKLTQDREQLIGLLRRYGYLH